MQVRALLLGLLLPGVCCASGVDILSNDAALQRWQPVGVLAAPSSPPGTSADTCINLGFLIDRNGATSAFALLRGWSAGAQPGMTEDARLDLYARHAAAAVQAWRFQAAATNTKRRPAYTQTIFVFLANRDAEPAAVRARCDIGDLRAHIEQAYGGKYRQGSIVKRQSDHARQQYPWQIPDGCTRHAGWCD